jgi:hypothetical protein
MPDTEVHPSTVIFLVLCSIMLLPTVPHGIKLLIDYFKWGFS